MPPDRRIDIHGHFLPDLDDGSRSLEESLELARRMADAGYSHLTCTPHIWAGRVHSPSLILDRVATLQRELDERSVPITLVAGGELNITDLDLHLMRDEEIPTYGMAGKYVLFDFWDAELPDDYWPRIERLLRMGATPIQAHPERIGAFQFHPLLLDELAARGVLLQCNLQCLADPPGSRTRSCAEQWLRDGRFFLLGSDAHRTNSLQHRFNGLRIAVELLGEAEVDRLTKTNPAKVIGLTPF